MTTEELKDFDELLKKGIEEAKEYRRTESLKTCTPELFIHNTENSYKETIAKFNFSALLDEIIQSLQGDPNKKLFSIAKHLAYYCHCIGEVDDTNFWDLLAGTYESKASAHDVGWMLYNINELAYTKIKRNLEYSKEFMKLAIVPGDPYGAEKFLSEHPEFKEL